MSEPKSCKNCDNPNKKYRDIGVRGCNVSGYPLSDNFCRPTEQQEPKEQEKPLEYEEKKTELITDGTKVEIKKIPMYEGFVPKGKQVYYDVFCFTQKPLEEFEALALAEGERVGYEKAELKVLDMIDKMLLDPALDRDSNTDNNWCLSLEKLKKNILGVR